jgi:hypothetical protein
MMNITDFCMKISNLIVEWRGSSSIALEHETTLENDLELETFFSKQ